MTTRVNYTERLRQLYYDPKTQGSAPSLHKILKKEGYSIISLKDVQEWMKIQAPHQILAPSNKEITYPPIGGPDGTFQLDLMFTNDVKRHNDGFKVILVIIEVTSRKFYAYPSKSKKSIFINELFKQFLKEIDYNIVNITSDNGGEFINDELELINEKHNINHYFAEVGDHHKLGKIDRMVRTIRGKIKLYMTSHNTLRYIDVLPDLVENYNNTVHSSTNMKPNEVTPSNADDIRNMTQKRKEKAIRFINKFKIGQKCRLLKKKSKFAKGTDYYTKSIYTITDINQMHIVVNNGTKEKNVKPYNIRLVSDIVETAPENPEIIKHDFKENKKINKFVRKQKKLQPTKENVNDIGEVIMNKRDVPIAEKRKHNESIKIGDRVKVLFPLVDEDDDYFVGTVLRVTPQKYLIKFDIDDEISYKFKNKVFRI